jgi:hypothetical protein
VCSVWSEQPFLLQFSLILVVYLAGRPEGIERERGEGERERPLSIARFSKKVKQKTTGTVSDFYVRGTKSSFAWDMD